MNAEQAKKFGIKPEDCDIFCSSEMSLRDWYIRDKMSDGIIGKGTLFQCIKFRSQLKEAS